jgi:hypothetical protein
VRLIQKMRAVTANPWRGEGELYREAVALGLDDDLVIQRLLRQKMRLLLQHSRRGARGQGRRGRIADEGAMSRPALTLAVMAAWLWVWAGPEYGLAHPLNPALLELWESREAAVEVLWRVPLSDRR